MSAPVSEGDVLAGKYRVDKVLGVGGMGVVVVARFQREARAAALVALASPPPARTPVAKGTTGRPPRAAPPGTAAATTKPAPSPGPVTPTPPPPAATAAPKYVPAEHL